jgi:hypothetical protein
MPITNQRQTISPSSQGIVAARLMLQASGAVIKGGVHLTVVRPGVDGSRLRL